MDNNENNWEDMFDDDDLLSNINENTLLIHRYLSDDLFTGRLR